jgi:hypothetical protein
MLDSDLFFAAAELHLLLHLLLYLYIIGLEQILRFFQTMSLTKAFDLRLDFTWFPSDFQHCSKLSRGKLIELIDEPSFIQVELNLVA